MVQNDFGHTKVGRKIDKAWPLSSSTKYFMTLLVTSAMCIAHELPFALPTICAGVRNPPNNTKMPNSVLCSGRHVTCRPM